ncbi:MAG: hypothetical protein OHK0017_13070 [Patescibacteria group bacterium]
MPELKQISNFLKREDGTPSIEDLTSAPKFRNFIQVTGIVGTLAVVLMSVLPAAAQSEEPIKDAKKGGYESEQVETLKQQVVQNTDSRFNSRDASLNNDQILTLLNQNPDDARRHLANHYLRLPAGHNLHNVNRRLGLRLVSEADQIEGETAADVQRRDILNKIYSGFADSRYANNEGQLSYVFYYTATSENAARFAQEIQTLFQNSGDSVINQFRFSQRSTRTGEEVVLIVHRVPENTLREFLENR